MSISIEAGIIDPTKVVRIALENAVSVASVLLLTEATLTEVPEPKTRDAAAGRRRLRGERPAPGRLPWWCALFPAPAGKSPQHQPVL